MHQKLYIKYLKTKARELLELQGGHQRSSRETLKYNTLTILLCFNNNYSFSFTIHMIIIIFFYEWLSERLSE